MNVVVGIDVGKNNLNYCVVDTNGEVYEEGIAKNNQDGFDLIQNIFVEYQADIIFEATGVYSARLQYFLESNEIGYVKLNPLKAKRETSTLRNTKNDKVDAKKLAILQLTKHYSNSHIEPKVYRELRRQHRFYQSISQERANAKNRVQRLLQETFANITDAVDLNSDVFYQIVAVIPHVGLIKMKSADEISDMLYDAVKHVVTRRKYAVALQQVSLETTVSVDKNSYALTELRYWASKVVELGKVKEKVLQEMVNYSSELEEVKIVKSIPGLGDLASVGLIAELGDIRRFNTPQKLNAYIGIDLIFNDSGQLKTSGFISKKGSPIARKLLYSSFLHIIMVDKRNNLKLTQWYRHRTATIKNGKKKVILGGMDRLLRLIHHLVIHQECFRLNSVS